MNSTLTTSAAWELGASEIVVWSLRLNPNSAAAPFDTVLNAAERQRSRRFQQEVHRFLWVQARGALRILLGNYLQQPQTGIAFAEVGRGKPVLANNPELDFNLSHSGNMALFAFARRQELGIDVEQVKPLRDMKQIAQRFFSAAEAAALKKKPPAEQLEAFFRCWTRKEAYLKATGDGLFTALDSFEVTLDAPARLLHVRNDDAAFWTLHDIDSVPGHAAAVAYRGRARALNVLPVMEAADILKFAQP